MRLSTLMGEALLALEALPFPTVAALEGPAMGGGAEVALACDLRVMADDAVLGLMHIRLSICPAWGGLERLIRLVGYSRSIEWLTAGAILNAQEAERHGLANQVVPKGEALAAAKAWLAKVADRDTQAVQSIKAILRQLAGAVDRQQVEAARKAFARLWAAPSHLQASQAFIDAKRARISSRT
jgi:enoyl-CoA hydratase